MERMITLQRTRTETKSVPAESEIGKILPILVQRRRTIVARLQCRALH
jgi:hypothetical protein